MSLRDRDVLIIDDDEVFRAALRKILEHAGLRVNEANSVKAGLESAEKLLPHIILSDIEMTPETGLDFLTKIKANRSLKHIPVVIVSGNTNLQTVHQALTLGAADYVVKPLNFQMLIRKIKKALKDDEFIRFQFDDSNRPKITATLPGNLISLGEAGFRIEAPIRLANHSPVVVKCPLFTKLQVEHVLLQTSNRQPRSVEVGQYYNEIKFVGIDQHSIMRIRETIGKW